LHLKHVQLLKLLQYIRHFMPIFLCLFVTYWALLWSILLYYLFILYFIFVFNISLFIITINGFHFKIQSFLISFLSFTEIHSNALQLWLDLSSDKEIN
jgi:hypothetical protein